MAAQDVRWPPLQRAACAWAKRVARYSRLHGAPSYSLSIQIKISCEFKIIQTEATCIPTVSRIFLLQERKVYGWEVPLLSGRRMSAMIFRGVIGRTTLTIPAMRWAVTSAQTRVEGAFGAARFWAVDSRGGQRLCPIKRRGRRFPFFNFPGRSAWQNRSGVTTVGCGRAHGLAKSRETSIGFILSN